MAASTSARFAGLTRAAPVSTRETVGTDTPARSATSVIVGFLGASPALPAAFLVLT